MPTAEKVKTKILEARPHAFRESLSGRREITIISEGWGSSGYYDGKVIERDIPTIFPSGTHMYLNHPTEAEEFERPERDVRDLVGTTASTPRFAGIESICEAKVYKHWQGYINEVASDIGTSMRSFGMAHEGSAGGKDGPIIDELIEGLSIDYVTVAGAGGKVGKMLEEARRAAPTPKPDDVAKLLAESRNCGNWLEAYIHRIFTERADYLFGEGYLTLDERKSLSAAVGQGLDAFHVALLDHAPELFKRDPYSDPEQPEIVYMNESGGSRRTKHKEDAMSDEEKRQFEESLRKLNEKVDGLTKDLKESEDRAKKAEDRADRAEESIVAIEAARSVRKVVEADDIKDKLPDKAAKRIVENALRDIPTTSEGKLDESAMTRRAEDFLKEEVEYLAEASGVGEVRGAGSSGGSSGSKLFSEAGREDNRDSDDDVKALEESLRRGGMSEEAAKLAARGR